MHTDKTISFKGEDCPAVRAWTGRSMANVLLRYKMHAVVRVRQERAEENTLLNRSLARWRVSWLLMGAKWSRLVKRLNGSAQRARGNGSLCVYTSW